MFYLWEKNQVFVSSSGNLECNEDWIIEVKEWSLEEQIIQSYNLRSLEFLAKKYLEKEAEIPKEDLENNTK